MDQASYQLSPNFNFPDADLTILSTDGTLFKVHQINLNITTGAFPPLPTSPNEIVTFTETAATLEILFQFMYPKRHPHLHDITFEELDGLAEAAEKYELFPAMNLCNIKMKEFASQNPAQVLQYACKHDYPHLIEVCAEFSLQMRVEEILSLLPAHLAIPWVLYRQQYITIWTQRVAACIKRKHNWKPGQSCQYWNNWVLNISAAGQDLLPHPSTAGKIFGVVDIGTMDPCCKGLIEEWKLALRAAWDRCKSFRTFI
ncbi:hypothetical protein DL96DRAFT_768465 [Flagelloscypha sp. PMI_526]|nr:hypothetical protein DL96DRAFT_768465 [Flagelloscypha sp. PMI_526]